MEHLFRYLYVIGRYSLVRRDSSYLKVAKRLDLKSSHHKKKNSVTKYGNRWQIDLLWWSFWKYTNIELLCCAPETNIMLYVNYNQLKKIFCPLKKIEWSFCYLINRTLYIFWIQILYQIYNLQIFSPSLAFFIVFLDGIFWSTEVFKFDESS